MTQTLLTDTFLDKYADFPEHMNEIGKFVYYRTYSRYLPEKGRRENWKETVKRATEYNVSLGLHHAYKHDLPIDLEDFKVEAEEFFDSMFNLRNFLSGRTLWVGGADGSVADKYPLANFNCFTPDTEFLTDEGLRSFTDFNDGDKTRVLTKTGGFKEATVRNFGKARVVEMVIRRGKRKETIETTDNHRWYVNKHGKYVVKTTADLQVDDILRVKRTYENAKPNSCRVGEAHGIVFGDGTYDKRKKHTRIALVGEKANLKDKLTGLGGKLSTAGKSDDVVYGLPHFFKELPSDNANTEYKLGFLKGLFATDGSLTNNQATISSASKDVMEFVRSTAMTVGMDVSNVRTHAREGFGKVSEVHEVTLYANTITKDFFLRDDHANHFTPSQVERPWKVDSVKLTDRFEDVWCVQEPETESFTLGNGVLTKNCSYTNIRSFDDLADLFYLLLVGRAWLVPTLNPVNLARGCR